MDHRAGTWLFLRVLGVVHLAAFVSLGVQAQGLVGSDGILPFAERLAELEARLGLDAYWRVPTLLWLWPTDAALAWVWIAGALAALLLIADIAPFLAALAAWALYLSLASVGGVFLGYQWDALLLETGLVALLVAPMRVRPRLPWGDRAPSRLALLVLGFLLFRLVFMSGWVKLASGDEAWRTLSALRYHYWTQPLPVWTSWYVHRLPEGVHRACEAAMLGIELVAPFLLAFGTRGWRRAGALLLLLLQAGIAATGNYGFFNLLSAALVLPMLDDALFAGRAPFRALLAAAPPPRWTLAAALGRVAVWDASLLLLALASFTLAAQLTRQPLPGLAGAAVRAMQPFESVNVYGLFAVMTRDRPEIVLEGRDDSGEWRAYEMTWKPGDPARRPRFAPLHMPRLDWQLWFAALPASSLADERSRASACLRNEWFLLFQKRLLEGSPSVTRLLGSDPFPEGRPRALRSTVWNYRFAGSGPGWWTRDAPRPYCPVVALDAEGALVRAE